MLKLLFICWAAHGNSVTLRPIQSIRLAITPAATPPEIEVTSRGQYFYMDHWEHRVLKCDARGRPIFTIGGIPGQGPGEINHPFGIGLIAGESRLLVLSGDGRLQSFDAETGTFLSLLNKNFFGKNILPWGVDQFLILGHGRHQKLIHRLDNSGKWQQSWFENPRSSKRVRSYMEAVALHNEVVYYQEGTYPEIAIIEKGNKRWRSWSLKQPKHYREPPDKPLNRAVYFDKRKVKAYLNSYTKLQGLAICFPYLAVCWDIVEPYKASLDVYHIDSREIVLSNTRVPGWLIAHKGNRLYFLEEREADETTNFDDSHWIHVMALEAP